MLDFLKKILHEDRWELLDHALTGAFEKIKGDTRNLYAWVKYFREKDIENDSRQERVSHELGEHEGMIRSLQMEVAMLKAELTNAQKNRNLSPFPDQVRTKSGPDLPSRIDQKIIAISRPVKKDYIMRQMVELVEKGNYSTKQVENIIVREKMLCGRTAFYDYLKELKIREQIDESEKGSKRVLISKD